MREAKRKNIKGKERKKIMYPKEAIRKSLQCSCVNPKGTLNLRKGSLEVVELNSTMRFWIDSTTWILYCIW